MRFLLLPDLVLLQLVESAGQSLSTGSGAHISVCSRVRCSYIVTHFWQGVNYQSSNKNQTRRQCLEYNSTTTNRKSSNPIPMADRTQAPPHTTDQDALALYSQYGDLYNEIVRPERKCAISHYLRTQWAPLLGPARLWFVIALRQRCFWNNKQDWCVVDKETLARESGLSLRTVNRIIAAADRPNPDGSRDNWTALFFTKTRRRRYSQYVGRTVNAPNRYHVLLDDPLTPAHQAALSLHLAQQTKGGSAQDTLQALQALCACSAAELYEILSTPAPESSPDCPLPQGFVIDLVQEHCPLPPHDSALYAEIVRAASRLHNAITAPERVHIGSQYFRLQWLPELGPVLALLVVNLRARCYWNARTGELRDSCRATWSELARELGCTARQLRNLRQKPCLEQFARILSEGHGRAQSEFRVSMVDPLTDADAQRFETQAKITPDVLIDPETGQLDAYALLLKAENSAPGLDDLALAKGGPARNAPGNVELLAQTAENPEEMARSARQKTEILASSPESQPEVSAASERQVLHLEGLKAEVLAVQPGSSGTTVQLQIITPTRTGLVETILEIKPTIKNKAQLLAAARDRLFDLLGIQEPNRTKLVRRMPRCDWIVGWGLYALTQPGLSKNRAGYIYNRLSSSDPPPQEFLEAAGLYPSTWRLFHRAERRGDDAMIPTHLHRSFELWRACLAEVCTGLSRSERQESGEDAQPELSRAWEETGSQLPDQIRRLLQGTELVEETSEGVALATSDLYHAYCLARAVRACACGEQVAVEVIGPGGRRYPLNAEVLALEVEPLPGGQWASVWQELQWQMDRAVFLRWWQGVKPLGVQSPAGSDVPCVVLGVPSAEARAWIETKHLSLVRRTLSGVLGQPVEALFVVYALAELVVEPVSG
jgi:hypothetical protein